MILHDSDYEYCRHASDDATSYNVTVVEIASIKETPFQTTNKPHYYSEIIKWLAEESSISITNLLRADKSSNNGVFGVNGIQMGPNYIVMFTDYKAAVLFKLIFGGRYLTETTIHIKQTFFLDKYLG